MTKPDTAPNNPQSEQAVNKQFSKFSAKYWEPRIYRPSYRRDGTKFEVAEWYAQVQHGGRREQIGLGSNERETASRKAAKFYSNLRAQGWDFALQQLDPERYSPRNLTTVGGYLEICKPYISNATTWNNYSYALRKIAMEIATGPVDDKQKYDPVHREWQSRADKVQISSLSLPAINRWKHDFIQRAGSGASDQIKARRSANSFILNARTLFGRRMAQRLADAKLTPLSNPFDGVELEKGGSTRYMSQISAEDILHAAKAELKESNPEAYKVVLLALGAGLRKKEIDMLRRQELDFKRSEVRIVASEHFAAKTQESYASVFVDSGLLSELKPHLDTRAEYVINPGTKARLNGGRGYYRCDDTFDAVSKWLRKQGVNDAKPLHTLRKEFGSIVNSSTDIHTASRQLRHATIKMTAAVYTDHRRRENSAPKIGLMLQGKAVSK